MLDPDVTPKYEPLLELGRGGMGKVLLARSIGAEGFERLVALKRMNAELLESDELVRRFVGEARLAAHVRHANVVAVHHFGRDADGYYLVLDYVEGVSLDSLVERCVELGTRPSPPIVLRIIADALAGLQAVHEAKDYVGKRLDILHRDVSIQNVLVGCDGLSRLSDFGIAKSILATHKTAENRLVGKLLYMTPEYLRQQTVNRTLDVYAMGMTMWIALAAVDPWPDLNDAQLISQILHGELPKLTDTGARIAAGFDDVVKKACARDPAHRYPTASAMGSAIAELGRIYRLDGLTRRGRRVRRRALRRSARAYARRSAGFSRVVSAATTQQRGKQSVARPSRGPRDAPAVVGCGRAAYSRRAARCDGDRRSDASRRRAGQSPGVQTSDEGRPRTPNQFRGSRTRWNADRTRARPSPSHGDSRGRPADGAP